MSGSYNHIINGWSLIENMGDAYELVEQLMWLIQAEIGTEKAKKLLIEKYYPMVRGESPMDDALKAVLQIMKR